MSHGNGDPRMVKLAELWERTSARGSRYFSGFMGDAQVLLFDGGAKPHPTRPGETVHVWRLMVQERDPARRPQARSPNFGASASGDGRDRDGTKSPTVRDLDRDADGPANRSASPVARGDGWRGSQYRRPANGARRAPAGDDGTFAEDDLG